MDVLKVVGINSKGFGIIPKLVMQDTRLTPEAKCIYAYFCSYAGNGNIAFPKVETIILHLNMGKKRYYSHFKSLTEFGYIEVEQVKNTKGKFSHNVYTLKNEITETTENTNVPPSSQNDTTDKNSPCSQNGNTGNRHTDNDTTNINNNISSKNNKDNKNNNNTVVVDNNTQNLITEVKTLLPFNCTEKDVTTMLELSNYNLKVIKKAVEAFEIYSKGKTIYNPISVVISAIKDNWIVTSSVKGISKQSTLKNFEEDEKDKNYDEIMAIHKKLTKKDLFV